MPLLRPIKSVKRFTLEALVKGMLSPLDISTHIDKLRKATGIDLMGVNTLQRMFSGD